jgi:serine kinase of HPr protein (carbohydrate metabolism regulator)
LSERPRNHHATALLLGDRGVMLRGPSGAGKTALALAIIDWARAVGVFGRFVGDDQVLLRRCGGRIVAEAPATIAGLAEIRGFGPVPTVFEPRALIDLVVDIVGRGSEPRYQPDATTMLLDIEVASLLLDAANPGLCIRAIAARLALITPTAGNSVPSDASN